MASSIIVPVFNSADILPLLVARLQAVLSELPGPHELILVNDGSRDDSWRVVQELSAKHDWVRGINLMRNYGQHCALLAGIREARQPIVITLDDDLQHPPEEIPRLLAMLEQDLDVVYGSPRQEQHGLWRDTASRITKLALQSAIGAENARNVSAFRAFRTDLRKAFAAYESPYVSIDVLLTWATTRFGVLKVEHAPRHSGESNYTFMKLVVHAINMATGFSTWPLRFASFVGFAFTAFGLLVLLYVVGRYLLEGSLPGFPFLASIIAIFAGAQLFALGIMGEYLARMHVRSMQRRAYTVRELVGGEPADASP